MEELMRKIRQSAYSSSSGSLQLHLVCCLSAKQGISLLLQVWRSWRESSSHEHIIPNKYLAVSLAACKYLSVSFSLPVISTNADYTNNSLLIPCKYSLVIFKIQHFLSIHSIKFNENNTSTNAWHLCSDVLHSSVQETC